MLQPYGGNEKNTRRDEARPSEAYQVASTPQPRAYTYDSRLLLDNSIGPRVLGPLQLRRDNRANSKAPGGGRGLVSVIACLP
jgi:hypothetical protein